MTRVESESNFTHSPEAGAEFGGGMASPASGARSEERCYANHSSCSESSPRKLACSQGAIAGLPSGGLGRSRRSKTDEDAQQHGVGPTPHTI